MAIRSIPLFKVFMTDKASQNVTDVLKSGFIGQGSQVDLFEKRLGHFLGSRYVVTTNSATSAEHLALHMLKDKFETREWVEDFPIAVDVSWPGFLVDARKVLVTPLTCAATVWPILANGMSLQWLDIDPQTLNVDLNDLEIKLTDSCPIAVLVHWGGYPIDLDRVDEIKRNFRAKYGFSPIIIEDCAHAFGSRYNGQYLGNHDNICTFSFQAIKHLTSVTPNTPVLIKDSHGIRLVEIGTLDSEIKGHFCASFDTGGKITWGQITDFIRHYIDDEILDITLEKGRRVQVTKSHSVFKYDGENFVPIPAVELQEGDYIAAPRTLNINDKQIESIDLLELLKHEKLMHCNGKIRIAHEGRGANAGKWIDRYINVTPQFCKMLGYYVAEGCINKHKAANGKSARFSNIVLSFGKHEETTYVQDVINCFESIWPYKAQKYTVNPNQTGMQVIYGSSLIAKIIQALNCGDDVYHKKIPEIIWRVNDQYKLAFIKGLLNGDGHERNQDGFSKQETLKVASKELANGLHYLLLTLGIQSSVATYKQYKNGKELIGYSVVICNREQQETCRENTVPKEFVDAYTNHNSFSLKRINERKLDVNSNLLQDVCLLKIKSIQKEHYSGYVYDFEVANHNQNFVGGYGSICLHNTGDGGCLIVSNKHLYERAKLLRWYGMDRSKSTQLRCIEDVPEWGFKFHMNDVAASIGLANLEYIKAIIRKHQDNAAYYNDELRDIPGLQLVQEPGPDFQSAYWLYSVLVDNRNDFERKMAEYGIACNRVHERNDKHSCVRKYQAFLPQLDKIADKICCIPVGWWVKEEDREYIADCIKKGW